MLQWAFNKIGLRFKEKIDIAINDTFLVIGEIGELLLPNTDSINEDIDLQYTNAVAISGLNSYYSLNKLDQLPYMRLNDVPNF